MEGLTKTEMEKIGEVPRSTGQPIRRPRDSATLLLLDRDGAEIRVLMGRRHSSHVFMPGKLVFPGGKTDPADSHVPVTDGLHPRDEQRLADCAGRISARRARAIALSAIRETYEEAGLLIGTRGEFRCRVAGWQGFVENEVQPSLSKLRFVARAITPPGRVRRYDTRFFAAWRDDVAVALPGGGLTAELEELVWLPLEAAMQADVPRVTGAILDELKTRLASDPDLSPGQQVPFYRMLHNRYVRNLL